MEWATEFTRDKVIGKLSGLTVELQAVNIFQKPAELDHQEKHNCIFLHYFTKKMQKKCKKMQFGTNCSNINHDHG